MKKILTVSLFAMMAVSAANADIASTKFVTDRTGNTEFEGSVAQAADLTAAVNALAGKVDTVAGSGEGSVSDQIDSALEDYTNTAGMNSAIAAAKGELTTEIGKVDDKVDANAEAIAVLDGTYATDTALSDGLALKEDVANKKGSTYTTGSETEYTSVLAAETIANKAVAASKAQLGALADLDTVSTEYIDDKNVTKAKLADDVQTSLGKADSAVQTVATGSANGTIAVDGEDVAVKGLGSAAYTASDAYDAAGSAAAAQTAAANALAAAKTELEGKITAASTSAGTNLTNALKDYSTTAQMNAAITNANSEQTTAITNAYTAADSALETKITNAYTVADTATLDAAKADATSKADAAQAAAITAAKSAGDAAYAAKSYEAIVDADKAFREEIANGTTTTGTDGTYALTATVSNGSVSGYKWELIGR